MIRRMFLRNWMCCLIAASAAGALQADNVPYGFNGFGAVNYALLNSTGIPGAKAVSSFFGTAQSACIFGNPSDCYRLGGSASSGKALIASIDAQYGNLFRLGASLQQGGSGFRLGNSAFPSVNVNFQGNNSLFAGGGFGNSFALSAVLGYNPNSNLNFGAQVLAAHSPYNPPSGFSGGFGFGGFGFFGRNRTAAVDFAEIPRSVGPNATTSQADLGARWQALGDQQLASYYNDPSLAAVRVEVIGFQLALVNGDSYLLYFSQELSDVLLRYYTSAPSYPALQSLSQEVASWTAPPSDPQVLQQRQSKRSALSVLTAQVQYEGTTLLAADPATATWVSDAMTYVGQQMQNLFTLPAVTAELAQLNTQFQQAYTASAGYKKLVQNEDRLFSDYPGFQEYLTVNQQLADLLPSYSQLPLVQQINSLSQQILLSPAVAQPVQQAYDRYVNTIRSILSTTQFDAVYESYWERLNALIPANPVGYSAITRLQEHQRLIHGAVGRCLSNLGNACDPNQDAQIVGLRQSSLPLLADAANFYDSYTVATYNFYQSSDYLALHTDTINRLQAALTPVSAAIQSAQSAYNAALAGIPALVEVQKVQTALGNAILNTPDVSRLVTRLAQLAATLGQPAAAPDLVIDSLTSGTSADAGGQLDTTMVVRNQGHAPAGPFRVGFYYAPFGVDYAKTVSVKNAFSGSACTISAGLAPGATIKCAGPINVPSWLSGTYIVGAIADETGQIAESNKDNNWRLADTGSVEIRVNPSAPAIASKGIANAASYRIDAIAPGEIISIFGNRLGPNPPTTLQVGANGIVTTMLAGARVLIGGVAAPLLFASNGQVSAIVPYSVANSRDVPVQVDTTDCSRRRR